MIHAKVDDREGGDFGMKVKESIEEK